MPKSTEFSFTVPGTPDEVSDRLKGQTRFRLIPVQGTVLVRTDRPLAGRVGKDSFAVSVNKRDWWTLMQAVAKGRMSQVPGGTLVEGQAGLPLGVTWQLRLATILAVLAGLGGVGGLAMGDAGPVGLPVAALFLCVILIATVFGIGLNVRNADEQIPELVSRLEAATLGPVTADETVETVEMDRKKTMGRAAAKQKQG